MQHLFGSNWYRYRIAAKTYFKTTPAKQITSNRLLEVGLLKATTTDPKINPKRSTERRNVVLQNLVVHKAFATNVQLAKKIPSEAEA